MTVLKHWFKTATLNKLQYMDANRVFTGLKTTKVHIKPRSKL